MIGSKRRKCFSTPLQKPAREQGHFFAEARALARGTLQKPGREQGLFLALAVKKSPC